MDISELQSLEIQHQIRDNEVLNPTNLTPFDGTLPTNIRFKVFKAKARALSQYDQLVQKTIQESIPPSRVASFNWPYDFFSLVEMAKVDIETTFEKESEQ